MSVVKKGRVTKAPKTIVTLILLIAQDCLTTTSTDVISSGKGLFYFILLFAHAREYSSVFACDVDTRYRKLRMLLRYTMTSVASASLARGVN
jgi:hypothetical protein